MASDRTFAPADPGSKGTGIMGTGSHTGAATFKLYCARHVAVRFSRISRSESMTGCGQVSTALNKAFTTDIDALFSGVISYYRSDSLAFDLRHHMRVQSPEHR